ncbi:MAG: SemiSWEET family transporter [Candidatus Woesearchaeota archaeon]
MDIIQITGYLAGIIIAISLTPQVIQAWKTKSTKDISLPWTITLLIGLLLYFVYGIGIMEMPIIFANFIETTLVILLIIAKLIYK